MIAPWRRVALSLEDTMAEETADTAATADEATQTGDGGAPGAVEDGGKKSLEDSLGSLDDSTRAFVLGEVRRARDEAKGLRQRLKDAAPKIDEYDRLIEASKSDLERAQEESIAANRRADELVARAVRAEIKAAASGFADPSDAAAFLDPSKYADDSGQIDTAAIAADLTALLQSKPHLAAQRGPRAPQPDPTIGGGNGGVPSAAEQAAAAAARGDWRKSMQLKADQLLALRNQ